MPQQLHSSNPALVLHSLAPQPHPQQGTTTTTHMAQPFFVSTMLKYPDPPVSVDPALYQIQPPPCTESPTQALLSFDQEMMKTATPSCSDCTAPNSNATSPNPSEQQSPLNNTEKQPSIARTSSTTTVSSSSSSRRNNGTVRRRNTITALVRAADVSDEAKKPISPTERRSIREQQRNLTCSNCFTTSTPLWRRAHESIVCNACVEPDDNVIFVGARETGLYHKHHGSHRPLKHKEVLRASAAAAGGAGAVSPSCQLVNQKSSCSPVPSPSSAQPFNSQNYTKGFAQAVTESIATNLQQPNNNNKPRQYSLPSNVFKYQQQQQPVQHQQSLPDFHYLQISHVRPELHHLHHLGQHTIMPSSPIPMSAFSAPSPLEGVMTSIHGFSMASSPLANHTISTSSSSGQSLDDETMAFFMSSSLPRESSGFLPTASAGLVVGEVDSFWASGLQF
ncbi:hypothetical protein CcCBS67573_g03027 [Chytriomyces confervae]|uniref:GATA-type domain-containing protein n=1 Tax=Chytriomyces confervae TaxID=246404 RepID=A0A507FHD9_9FUNG|nr:hypothetical protein CcCBS67573_g03027 [Chytriomyces confervae]